MARAGIFFPDGGKEVLLCMGPLFPFNTRIRPPQFDLTDIGNHGYLAGGAPRRVGYTNMI